MDFAAILHEIDAEIEKLHQIRSILVGINTPASPRKRATQPVVEEPLNADPEPRIIVLPPKEKREYRPRPRSAQPEPRALAAPALDRPVFVPKAVPAPPAPATAAPALDAESLEAAIRRSLLGGAA